METNDQENNSGQELPEKVQADNESTLTPAQRQAIGVRWDKATEDASLDVEIEVPHKLKKVALTNPDPGTKAKTVRLQSLRLHLPLSPTALIFKVQSASSRPLVAVKHTGTKIFNDPAFDARVAEVLNAAIDKPVTIRSVEESEDRMTLLEVSDEDSAWHLADFILAEAGYADEPGLAIAEAATGISPASEHIGEEQMKFLEARYKQFHVKGWDELLVKLKVHGGKMIVPIPEPELHVQWLLKDGRLFSSDKLNLQPGEPNRCHENVGRAWAENEQLQIITGYALDKDLWYQHSWAWNPSTGVLIETTQPWTKYFGVVLSDMQANKFALENVEEFRDPSNWTPRIIKGRAKINQLLARVGQAKLIAMLESNEEVPNKGLGDDIGSCPSN